MNNRSERLKIVVALQERREREALLTLGSTQRKMEELQKQLQNLQNYLCEHQEKFAAKQGAGISIQQLMESRAFAEKLNKAISIQQDAVTAYEQNVLRARLLWEESRQRTKSLQKAVELAIAEESSIQGKREQYEQDARAARVYRKNGMRNA